MSACFLYKIRKQDNKVFFLCHIWNIVEMQFLFCEGGIDFALIMSGFKHA